MSLIARLPLWLKLAVLTTLCLVASAAVTQVFVQDRVANLIAKKVLQTQSANIEVAARILASQVDGVTINRDADATIESVTLAAWPELASAADPDHTYIDFVTDMTGETATIFAYDPAQDDFVRRTTNIIKPDGNRAVGTVLGKQSAAYAPNAAGDVFLGQAVILGKAYQTLYLPIMAANDAVPANRNGVAGILYVGVEDAELVAQQQSVSRGLLLIAGLATVFTALATSFSGFVLLRPLRQAAAQTNSLADGEKVDVTITRADEIGALQVALQKFAKVADQAALRQQIVEQSDLATLSASVADGFAIDTANPAAIAFVDTLRKAGAPMPTTLTGAAITALHTDGAHMGKLIAEPDRMPHVERVRFGDEVVLMRIDALRDRGGAYAGPMVTLRSGTAQERTAATFETDVGSLLEKIDDAIQALNGRTETLEDAANSGAQNTDEATHLASTTSEAVQSVASAIEQLTGSFAEVAQQIRRNADIAKEAAAASEGAATTARALDEAGQRISDVVGLIAEVAGQTNLLALNATIEASRAGEAGRGFAVVASEVKNLAGRASQATSEITTEVERVKGAGEDLLTAMEKVQSAIARVDEVSSAVAAAVEQQQVTTDDISRTVQDVAGSAERVRDLAEHARESAGRTGEAAQAVATLTAELDETGGDLRERANGFIDAFRKAA
ncbi:MAG: methyl-accepting chemotaxis protein [Pseudomonadota bacterium]